MKKLFSYLIILSVFFLLCGNTVHAGRWIAAGDEHTVVLKEDGTVWAWGYNEDGELGNATWSDSSTPVQAYALSNVKAMAAGYWHTFALKQDGTVWAWGWNDEGQLGNGTYTSSSTPVQVGGLSNMTAITGGEEHTVALRQDGTVWAWGYNEDGELGNGTYTSSSTPVQVSVLSNVTAIAAGEYHAVALKQDGTVWAWGWNGNGQLGDGTQTNSPTPIQVFSGVTAITAGSYHTVAQKQDGTVWAWGWNATGQLGDGTLTDRLTPVQVSGLSTNVTEIEGGENHTVARKLDGTVWAWGYNEYGRLGDGTTTDRLTPIQVSGLYNMTDIEAGDEHTVALKQDGTVWAWGANWYGQLGNGTYTDSSTPVKSNGVVFSCTYSFSPSNYGYSALGGSGSVNVNPSGGSCNWTAASSDLWISVTSGSSGTGTGAVAYNVSPNATGNSRTGKISIGNQDIFILQAPGTFLDNPNNMFTSHIYAINTEGITRGCWGDTNYYCPDDVVTRGAMAAFIIRAIYGEDFSYTQTPYFTDVPESNGYFKYVQKMKDEGITGNVGTYNWTDVVIRQHMAAFLARAFLGMQ